SKKPMPSRVTTKCRKKARVCRTVNAELGTTRSQRGICAANPNATKTCYGFYETPVLQLFQVITGTEDHKFVLEVNVVLMRWSTGPT
ncbi:hypothetical protein WDW89_12880, partial [Deltaproteobacteria bacterium TL4]